MATGSLIGEMGRLPGFEDSGDGLDQMPALILVERSKLRLWCWCLRGLRRQPRILHPAKVAPLPFIQRSSRQHQKNAISSDHAELS